MKSAIEDCLSNRNLLKILLFFFLYIFIIFFQICLSRHIYNRMHHQNYSTWFYNQQIYIFTRSLELVRFCSSRFSVSTYDLIFIATLLKHHFFLSNTACAVVLLCRYIHFHIRFINQSKFIMAYSGAITFSQIFQLAISWLLITRLIGKVKPRKPLEDVWTS